MAAYPGPYPPSAGAEDHLRTEGWCGCTRHARLEAENKRGREGEGGREGAGASASMACESQRHLERETRGARVRGPDVAEQADCHPQERKERHEDDDGHHGAGELQHRLARRSRSRNNRMNDPVDERKNEEGDYHDSDKGAYPVALGLILHRDESRRSTKLPSLKHGSDLPKIARHEHSDHENKPLQTSPTARAAQRVDATGRVHRAARGRARRRRL